MIYIGLGSNIGSRANNINDAIRRLNADADISVVTRSSLYKTEPFGYREQPFFVNAVIGIATILTPSALLQRCLDIEQDMGRVRKLHWGPRIIDIDILLFDGVTMATERLTLPHPGVRQRNFVLVPLAEIAGDSVVLEGYTAAQLLQQAADDCEVRLFEAKKPKVLFLSAPFGSGHIRAAEAVAVALKEIDPGIETEMANVFDFISPLIGRFVVKGYLQILKWMPWLYRGMYDWGDSSKLALWARAFINRIFARRMFAYIEAYQPTCIVCTHVTPAGMIEQLVRDKFLSIPTLAIITDFVVHRWWVYPLLDEYFVANQEMRDYLSTCGIDYNRTFLTGMPIHSAFLATPEVSSIYNCLGLDSTKRLVLVMGGGAGVLPMDKIVTECDKTELDVQFLAVSGKNEQIYRKLLALQNSLRHTLRVVTYVDYIDKLMAMADVLISKPGGMTSSECLCRELPMIIFRPIPGQEEANTDYLVSHELAVRVDTVADVRHWLEKLLGDDELAARIRHNMAEWKKPYAADVIAQHIIDNT